MKSKQNMKSSFMNAPFRCAVSALMAFVFGILLEIHTAFAEENDAGTKVVEEVIDTVDATTAVADTVIKNIPVFLVRILTAGLIILIGVLAISLGKRIIQKLTSRPNKKTDKIRKTETMRSVLISLLRYLVSMIVVVSILTVAMSKPLIRLITMWFCPKICQKQRFPHTPIRGTIR